MHSHYGFTQEPEFDQDVLDHIGDMRVWDEASRGLQTMLGKDPLIGAPVPGTDLRVLAASGGALRASAEELRLYYRTNEERGTIHLLRLVPNP